MNVCYGWDGSIRYKLINDCISVDYAKYYENLSLENPPEEEQAFEEEEEEEFETITNGNGKREHSWSDEEDER